MCKYRTDLLVFFPRINLLFQRRNWSASWESHIICWKWYSSTRFNHEVTLTFDIGAVEIIHISEFHDNNSKYIFIYETLWCKEFWPTTEEFSLHTFFVDDVLAKCCIKRYSFYYRFEKFLVLFECNGSSLLSNHLSRNLTCYRQNVSCMFDSISHTDFMWIAWKWYHICSFEWICIIIHDDISDFWEIDSIISHWSIVPANVLNWLEYDSSYTLPFLCILDKFWDFPVIESLVNDTYKCGWYIVFLEYFECFLSHVPHITIANRLEGFSIEWIKLEIYFESFSDIFDFLYKCFILWYTDSIGIEHEMSNGARLQELENLDNIRMNTWLSTRYLDKIWCGFDLEKCFMHFFDFLETSIVSTSGFWRMITDITLHIAFIDHIEECQTWMILMLRTDSTIKRTTSLDRSEWSFREIRFFEIIITLLIIFQIIWDNRPDFSTIRTELAKPNLLSLGDYMSRNESFLILTFMTKWFCCREEEIVVGWVVGHRYYLKGLINLILMNSRINDSEENKKYNKANYRNEYEKFEYLNGVSFFWRKYIVHSQHEYDKNFK